MKKLLLLTILVFAATGFLLKGLDCGCDNGSWVKEKGGCAKSCKNIGSTWSGKVGFTPCQQSIQDRDTIARNLIDNDQIYQKALQDYETDANKLDNSELAKQVKTIYDKARDYLDSQKINSQDSQYTQKLQQYLKNLSDKDKAKTQQLKDQYAALGAKLDAAKNAVRARVDQNAQYQAAAQKVNDQCK